MTAQDIKFVPHSDMSIYDVDIVVNQHQNLIKNSQFSDATTLLDNKNYNKGFRASLFNNMQNKVRMIQECLIGQEDGNTDEIYSDIEPTDSDVAFWIIDY